MQNTSAKRQHHSKSHILFCLRVLLLILYITTFSFVTNIATNEVNAAEGDLCAGAGVCPDGTHCEQDPYWPYDVICVANEVPGGNCTIQPPAKPILSSPTDGSEIHTATSSAAVSFDWQDVTDWGRMCKVGVKGYSFCVGPSLGSPCTTSQGGQQVNIVGTIAFFPTPHLTDPASVTTAIVSKGVSYWKVRSFTQNNAASPYTSTWNVCVEGFSASDPNYMTPWSACDPVTHKRTRTCREDCGINDCGAVGGTVTEDCLGQVRGTIFDASGIDVCPAFDPATGYLTGLGGRGAANKTFGFTDQSSVSPHPLAPLSPSITDASGNYSINVYAPSTYLYDFSSLEGYYSVSSGPKLTCTSSTAAIPDNSPTCTTQPCSVVNNMSFGFDKVFGGWWQTQGAPVHAEGGITSRIPSSLPTEQSLILPETTPINRWGFLSYGLALPQMLGNNTSAQVSTMLWEKLSSYQGLIYDWNYYSNRFNLFTRTEWNGTDPIVYDDQGRGYQIFRSNSSVSNFNFSPTGTQKVIFEINGDVTISGNISVPSGAFLGVIAHGTISFVPSVTSASGWYVGDRIAVPCQDTDGTPGCDKTDSQFIGNGSFVGWLGIDLSRDTGASSNTAPSELFAYRRDLYTNAPNPLKTYTKYYKPFIP